MNPMKQNNSVANQNASKSKKIIQRKWKTRIRKHTQSHEGSNGEHLPNSQRQVRKSSQNSLKPLSEKTQRRRRRNSTKLPLSLWNPSILHNAIIILWNWRSYIKKNNFFLSFAWQGFIFGALEASELGIGTEKEVSFGGWQQWWDWECSDGV